MGFYLFFIAGKRKNDRLNMVISLDLSFESPQLSFYDTCL